MAEDWRLVTDDTRREYEEKAQRFNVEEEKKWRQKVFLVDVLRKLPNNFKSNMQLCNRFMPISNSR